MLIPEKRPVVATAELTLAANVARILTDTPNAETARDKRYWSCDDSSSSFDDGNGDTSGLECSLIRSNLAGLRVFSKFGGGEIRPNVFLRVVRLEDYFLNTIIMVLSHKKLFILDQEDILLLLLEPHLNNIIAPN